MLRHIQLYILLAGTALLAGLALWAGLPAVFDAFAALGLLGFLLVVLLHLPLIMLMGAAWWSIGRGAGPLSFVEARLVRDSGAELLPFSQVGGFAAGIRLLSLAGVPAREGGFSLFADLLMEFVSKLPYAMVGLALMVWLRPASPLPAWLLATLVVLAAVAILPLIFRGWLVRLVPRLLHRWVPDDRGLRSYIGVGRLAPSGLLHALCWTLGGVEAWVTLRLMGVPVTLFEALAIDSLVVSLRTFGFWVPAALGVQEAAYVLVLGLFGLGPHVAIAFSLVRRARDLLIGVIGLSVWQGREVTRGRRAASVLEATPEP